MHKTVAITGATGTLGKACVERFCQTWRDEHEWHVHGCGRRQIADVIDNFDSMYLGEERLKYSPVDVTNLRHVGHWLDIVHNFCGLDALVTCAGVSLVGRSTMLAGEFGDCVDVNLNGSFYAAAAAVHYGATRIVFIGSIHGCTPTSYPKRAAYTASKAGIAGLTRALAVEWAPRGVAVNCVAPGHLPALMDGTGAGQALLDAAKTRTPTGRLTTPDEVADVVFWLCNDAPMSLTGQVITVDGGFTLNTWPMEGEP